MYCTMYWGVDCYTYWGFDCLHRYWGLIVICIILYLYWVILAQKRIYSEYQGCSALYYTALYYTALYIHAEMMDVISLC